MSKSCFRGEDTDGQKEESSFLLFVAYYLGWKRRDLGILGSYIWNSTNKQCEAWDEFTKRRENDSSKMADET